MKTRKKEIDVRKLLGISSRSKKITKKRHSINLNRDENASKSDKSDKENENLSRNPITKVTQHERRVLSPLKVQSQDERTKSPLKRASAQTSLALLSPLSTSKANPGATSTPNIICRTLFPEADANVDVPEPNKDDLIVLSDSDCTDTEIEPEEESDKGPQGKQEIVNKRIRRRKRRTAAELLENVDPVPSTRPLKRVVRPTFKALNSPSHRKFFTTPRIVPSIEDTSVANAVKLTKTGALVVEVPSRLALVKEIATEAPVAAPKQVEKGNVKPKKVQKEKIPVDDDSKRMPAPTIPIKKGRAPRAKRIVRLYSEPKPVPKNADVVPKYRQELEKGEVASRTLRRLGSAAGDDDIYNFHPSQEIVDDPEKDDSYIKELIERLKKRKRPGRKKQKVEKKGEDLVPTVHQQNHTEAVVERIRQRISEKHPQRSSLRKSGPDDGQNVSRRIEKSVHFEIPDASVTLSDSLTQENVPLPKSPFSRNVQNRSISASPASRDISMLPPITSPIIGSPNLSRGRIIRDPVPGTSTGGWTNSGRTHSTPNPKTQVSQTSFNSPLNRSSTRRSLEPPINSPNSPWRVNEDRVPRTKYFSLSNKDLLPSYSSDVIVHDDIPCIPDRNLSNLNNSDAENVAPDSRKTPKMRKGPIDRVPLGPLEVGDVHQVSDKHQPVTQSPLVRHSLAQKDLQAHRPQIQIISNVPVTGNRYRLSGDRLVLETSVNPEMFSDDSNMSATSNVSDCFGFDTESVGEELPEEEITETDLKKKLKNLKKVFPLEKSVSQDVEMPVLFKSPVKQTNTLKTMLLESHTPTQRLKPVQRAEEQTFVDSSDDDSDIEVSDPSKLKEVTDVTNMENVSIKLFDDPEDLRVKQVPVAKRRSYAGRQKRKRVHFSDYETSASEIDEDDDGEDGKHRHKKRKRTKPDVEKSEEFQQFVCEFNSMCDEVDQYELVVEPIEK